MLAGGGFRDDIRQQAFENGRVQWSDSNRFDKRSRDRLVYLEKFITRDQTFHFAGIQDRNARANFERFEEIVGHKYGSDMIALLQAEKLLLHFVPGYRVEGAKRFVEQQQAGLGGQRPGNPDSLPLPPRELTGRSPGHFSQTHLLQQVPCTLLLLFFRPAQEPRDHCHVFFYRPVREQAKLLNDVSRATA